MTDKQTIYDESGSLIGKLGSSTPSKPQLPTLNKSTEQWSTWRDHFRLVIATITTATSLAIADYWIMSSATSSSLLFIWRVLHNTLI